MAEQTTDSGLIREWMIGCYFIGEVSYLSWLLDVLCDNKEGSFLWGSVIFILLFLLCLLTGLAGNHGSREERGVGDSCTPEKKGNGVCGGQRSCHTLLTSPRVPVSKNLVALLHYPTQPLQPQEVPVPARNDPGCPFT